MIAKLRVAWTVADCAPGVRTITRSVLFHCTTGLTDLTAKSSELWCSSSAAALQELAACPDRLAQSSVTTIRSFDIADFSPLLLHPKMAKHAARQNLDVRTFLHASRPQHRRKNSQRR